MSRPSARARAIIALSLTVGVLLAFRGNAVLAQSAPFLVNTVEIDVVPGQIDNYLAALEENAATAIKEPGCREYNITVSQKDPNHVFIFEVYDNVAAMESHRQSDHFKQFLAVTKEMVAKHDVRRFSSVSMHEKAK